MNIKERLDAVKSLQSKNCCLKNQISDRRILMESTTRGLQEEGVKNDIKDRTIEELNEIVCRIAGEKMKMKSEHKKSIDDMLLGKKMIEDEFLAQQEVAKETIRSLLEAI